MQDYDVKEEQKQPLQQEDIQVIQEIILEKKIMTSQLALEILIKNPIPNKTTFIHQFQSISPIVQMCGGINQEKSTFILPCIGTLIWDVQFEMPPLCQNSKDPKKIADLLSKYIPQSQVPLNEDDVFKGCFINEHFFHQLNYCLENEIVRIEFFGHIGKLYILKKLVLELVECNKNQSDLYQASKFSTMPQIIVYEPHYHKKRKLSKPLRVKAEKNNCPEHPYSTLGFQSIFGCCKLSKNFEVYGLEQGTCEIVNNRSEVDARYSHMGCRDSYFCDCDSCNFPDYMNFQIIFNDVTQIDRLKILFALIHFNMYNKWQHTDYKGRHLHSQINSLSRKIFSSGECTIF